jgi:hypothetical protein
MPERVTRWGRALPGNAATPSAVCTIGAMAYDQELAERIRQLIGSDQELTEKKMFGGLAFAIRGGMAIAASGQGGARVRVDPALSDSLVATTKAMPREQRWGFGLGEDHNACGRLVTDSQVAGAGVSDSIMPITFSGCGSTSGPPSWPSPARSPACTGPAARPRTGND